MSQPYQLKVPVIVDVYQDEYPVKWEKMNPKPYRAILQCTKGQFHQDEKCATYIQECNALGIKYGLYHFLFPNNIDEQVENFIQRVMELGGLGHFPPVIDVEFEPQKMKKGQVDNLPRGKPWSEQIKICLDALEAHFGEKPMIYTNKNYWNYTHSPSGPPAWTNDYPLWIGWYPDKKFVDGKTAPRADRMPKGWEKWALWQYSESGRTDKYLVNDLNIITPEYMAELDRRFP
jgi:lysozyme